MASGYMGQQLGVILDVVVVTRGDAIYDSGELRLQPMKLRVARTCFTVPTTKERITARYSTENMPEGMLIPREYPVSHQHRSGIYLADSATMDEIREQHRQEQYRMRVAHECKTKMEQRRKIVLTYEQAQAIDKIMKELD